MENVLTDMITNPEIIEDLMDQITQYNLKVISKALDIGFDGVYFGDDWGWQRGLIMGPAMWRNLLNLEWDRCMLPLKTEGERFSSIAAERLMNCFPTSLK
jgi:uroporphyrinogen decarboxylase